MKTSPLFAFLLVFLCLFCLFSVSCVNPPAKPTTSTVLSAQTKAVALIKSPTAQAVAVAVTNGTAAAINDVVTGNKASALSDAGKAVLSSIDAQANGNKALVALSAVGKSVLADELAGKSKSAIAIDAGFAAAAALLTSPSTAAPAPLPAATSTVTP